MINRWIQAVCLAIIVSSILVCTTPVTGQEWVKLFEDHFESGDLTSWQIQSKDAGKAWIGEEPSGNRFLECLPTVTCFTGDLSWTDYVIKTKFYLVSGSADIKVRQNASGYVVQVTKGKCSLWKEKGGSDYKIWELETSPAPIEWNTWYGLGISCKGNTLYICLYDSYWNEPPLWDLKYEDRQDPIRYGNIGLGVGSFDSSSHARFDDVLIFSELSPAISSASAVPSFSPTSGPPPITPTATPSQPSASGLPIGTLASIVSTSIAVCTFTAYLITRRTQTRQKRYLKKLINELDMVYTRFKMNARRCEAELYRLHDIIGTDLKEGKLEEPSYAFLDKRITTYMNEIQQRIIDESLASFPTKLKDTIRQLMEKGEMDENQFAALEKIILATSEVSETDKVRLREFLERWHKDNLKKDNPGKPNP